MKDEKPRAAESGEELELVEAFVRRGEEEAFRQLYRRHTPRIYRVALPLVGGVEADAADVVQETWVRAAGHLETFAWRSALSTWLVGIAINCARELLRRRRSVSQTDAPGWASPRQRDPRRAGELLDLERAVASLSDGYREILVLHDVEGFTHEEIGGLLGIDSGTSKSQLHRARRRVREYLAGREKT